jgi:hypothetical protein
MKGKVSEGGITVPGWKTSELEYACSTFESSPVYYCKLVSNLRGISIVSESCCLSKLISGARAVVCGYVWLFA